MTLIMTVMVSDGELQDGHEDGMSFELPIINLYGGKICLDSEASIYFLFCGTMTWEHSMMGVYQNKYQHQMEAEKQRRNEERYKAPVFSSWAHLQCAPL